VATHYRKQGQQEQGTRSARWQRPM